MRRNWGLRAKMSASYVLVTAAAVLVVEIVVLVVAGPLLRPPSTADPSLLVRDTSMVYATAVIDANARLGHLPTAADIQLGETDLQLAPGQALLNDHGKGVRVPFIPTALPGDGDGGSTDGQPVSLALLLDPSLTIVASSYPARYPVGARIGGLGLGALPIDEIVTAADDFGPNSGQRTLGAGSLLWAVAPIDNVGVADARGVATDAKEVVIKDSARATQLLGAVYVQVPATPELIAAAPRINTGGGTNVASQLGIGLVVLLGALPVGMVFGLLATRSPIRRLRRLAASTVAVADGQYQHRIPVSGRDEITTLESSFNRMAERLTDAMTAERHLASATERARIARELHDSISQDLFSLRLLAGGLRRALPAGSALHPQVAAMERTASGTMHEMQALLLELRPVALQDAGLLPTLAELCRTYRDRLGVAVEADLEPVELEPAAEHAVLRIVQEALANAVKHARPARVTVRTRSTDGQVAVTVTDDGAGFDPARVAGRHGMGLALMRERVTELGGTFALESSPGAGTSIRVLLGEGRP